MQPPVRSTKSMPFSFRRPVLEKGGREDAVLEDTQEGELRLPTLLSQMRALSSAPIPSDGDGKAGCHSPQLPVPQTCGRHGNVSAGPLPVQSGLMASVGSPIAPAAWQSQVWRLSQNE